MRAIWIAGIGGLAIGHILWLAGISAAVATNDVAQWVLVVAGASLAVGWRAFRGKTRTGEIWAAFLWGLPISPVLFSLIVLGVTYL